MQAISQYFTEDVMDTFDVNTALKRRGVIGGTSPEYLDIQLQSAKDALTKLNV
jgi:argininosuccinate lyase